MKSFLATTSSRVLTAVILLQGVLFYAFANTEHVPVAPDLKTIPRQLNDWQTIQESEVSAEVEGVLRADTTLSRVYVNQATRNQADLFIAFFRSQRAGVTPHSPKVCLPAAGWVSTEDSTIPVQIPGVAQSIDVNRYVIFRGPAKSVILYWYQTPYRVVANELAAKWFLVVDGFRHRRSDASLVRVVAPVIDDKEDAANRTAVSFVQTFYKPIDDLLSR
jgi:EpsI family protein